MMNKTLLALARAAFSFSGLAAGALAIGITATPQQAFAGAHSTSSSGELNPALIYHNYCSVCHGDKGDGRSRAQGSLNPPPRDFTAPAAAAQLPREYMVAIVKNGKPGTAMVGLHSQLNPREIEAVVDYVRSTFMQPGSAAGMDRGKTVYAKNCSVCHGDKGDGRSRAQASLNPPPRDFTSPATKNELSRDRMIASVTYGRADTAMAGFKTQLSGDDINAVVDYIRADFMGIAKSAGISGTQHGKRQNAPGTAGTAHAGVANNPAAAAALAAPAAPGASLAADMSAPLPLGLKGDAVKGGSFYMNNCATCHGTVGDGRGPRAYFINPKPRNFLHPASRQAFNRPALFNAISNGKLGTEMPAWDKVMEKQEIADVAEFVFQRFIQPPAANSKQAKSR